MDANAHPAFVLALHPSLQSMAQTIGSAGTDCACTLHGKGAANSAGALACMYKGYIAAASHVLHIRGVLSDFIVLVGARAWGEAAALLPAYLAPSCLPSCCCTAHCCLPLPAAGSSSSSIGAACAERACTTSDIATQACHCRAPRECHALYPARLACVGYPDGAAKMPRCDCSCHCRDRGNHKGV